jgi:hypothetical protein
VKFHHSLIVTGQWKRNPRRSKLYERSRTGDTLICDGVSFSLNDVRPGLPLSVGSTKDNQLALASSGKVFPFGPLKSASENIIERLATAPPPADYALVTTRHSVLIWPTPFDQLNDRSISVLERHIYYEIVWKKSSGANLQMVWCYEQFCCPENGWTSGFMTRQGSTGLVRVEIK